MSALPAVTGLVFNSFPSQTQSEAEAKAFRPLFLTGTSTINCEKSNFSPALRFLLSIIYPILSCKINFDSVSLFSCISIAMII